MRLGSSVVGVRRICSNTTPFPALLWFCGWRPRSSVLTCSCHLAFVIFWAGNKSFYLTTYSWLFNPRTSSGTHLLYGRHGFDSRRSLKMFELPRFNFTNSNLRARIVSLDEYYSQVKNYDWFRLIVFTCKLKIRKYLRNSYLVFNSHQQCFYEVQHQLNSSSKPCSNSNLWNLRGVCWWTQNTWNNSNDM